MGFLISGLVALGGAPPLKPDGEVDYPALDAALDDARAYLVGEPDGETGDMAGLRRDEPQRFAWDHVLVDEAQDWSNAKRYFLRALYGHRRLVLADGIDQLVRRQIACDWTAGLPQAERLNVPLGTSLRMLRNVALFANCTARALGFDTWRITPGDDLPDGRIIVCTGEIAADALLPAIVAAARADRADPVDCLICIPPSGKEEGRRRARLATAAEALGIAVWDGCDPALRGTAPESNAALRFVQYDSCRGLEGWITVALDVDEFWKNKEKHPQQHPAGAAVPSNMVADRWMLIPLTRAVHTLVVSVRDPSSPAAVALREATDDPAMPRGVVEWIAPEQLAERLGS